MGLPAEPGVLCAGSRKSSKKYKIIVNRTKLLKTAWMPAKPKGHVGLNLLVLNIAVYKSKKVFSFLLMPIDTLATLHYNIVVSCNAR